MPKVLAHGSVVGCISLTLVALLALAQGGCKPRQARMLQYDVGRQNGTATLTLGEVKLVLLGVPSKGQDVEKMATGQMMTSGTGNTSGGSGVDDINLKYQYRDGVLTIKAGETQLEVIESGKTLRVGGETFPLDGKRTITVNRDGTIASMTK